MKTIEKLILCCIWICIAIVAVLIKDQADMQRVTGNELAETIKKPEMTQIRDMIVLSEAEVLDIVASNLPVMSDASLSFSKEGIIQMNVMVDDTLIEQLNKLADNQTVSVFFPLLKGMEISCQATISSDEVKLMGCKAGFISIPEDFLGLVEKEINKTWMGIVDSEGIESAEVHESGLRIEFEQD